MKKNDKTPFWERAYVFWLICICIIGLWLLWPYLIVHFANSPEYEKKGQFGDMFGALNTLFAGLAFAGLLRTVMLQSAQIRDAKNQSLEHDKQTHKDRFEATFFQLVNTFNHVIDSFSEYSSGFNSSQKLEFSGRILLARDVSTLYNTLKFELKEINDLDKKSKLMKTRYSVFFEHRDTRLAHYFRMLYRIMRWIDTAPENDQEIYAKILRAQLSSQELVLIFFNCLGEYGEGMKPLVEKYSLLKHLPAGELILDMDKALFKQSAFHDPK